MLSDYRRLGRENQEPNLAEASCPLLRLIRENVF